MKTAEEFLVERFDKDGIGAPPKHVYKSITNVMEEYAKSGQHETIVMQHKEIKQLAYDAVAFLEQLDKEGEFKFWGAGYNRQALDEIKSDAKKLGVA